MKARWNSIPELAALGIDDVTSAGFNFGNASSVVVNGQEVSPNTRGFNIVVISPNGIAVSSIDTYVED